jgi:secreted PhoX family phosphatase
MLSVMTRAILLTRVISISVIATLFFTVVQPAWAQDEEEGGVFKDPTIVTDDSTSVPDGVKDLGKKEKKPIDDPVYAKWWFWATAVGVAGAVIAASVIPFQKKAPGCGSQYGLGCIGDGR